MSPRLFPRLFLLVCAVILLPIFATADEPTPKMIDMHAKRQAIHNALLKQIDWNFKETPLSVVADKLQEELGIPVLLDHRALADLDVKETEPVTLKVKGISAKSALSIILREFSLTFMTKNEVLLITSPDTADNSLITITYDVTDLVLVEGESEGPDFESLIDMISKTIMPTTWDGVGGSGSVQPFQSAGIYALVISQTEEVHELVSRLLFDLRALRQPAKKTAEKNSPGTPIAKPLPPEPTVAEKAAREAEEKIRKALKTTVDLDFENASLSEVLASLEKQTGQKFQLNKQTIGAKTEVDGMASTTKKLPPVQVDKILAGIKISIHRKNLELATALDRILAGSDLSWTVWSESIWIMQDDFIDSFLVTRTYDVSDLPSFRTKNGETSPNYEQLIDMITKTIQPTTWDCVGGPGSIQPVDAHGIQALVVHQTWQNQEQVGELLDNLRKLRKKPLTKEELEKLPPPPAQAVGEVSPDLKALLGMNGQPVEKLPCLEPDADRNAVVKANNFFSFDIYAKLREKNKDNLFFSPYSLSTALSMACAGAQGDTALEMQKTLYYPLLSEEIPQAYHSLLKAITPPNKEAPRLLVANRLWCQSNFKYRESFLGTCRDQYLSSVGQVDFANNTEIARKEINAWVGEKTKGKIKELFDKDSIKDNCRLAITNAVYFKDVWQDKFDKNLTKPAQFQTETGSVRVQMMNQQRFYNYAEVDNVQILEKPYSDGRWSMIFLLRKKDPGELAIFGASSPDDKLEKSLSDEKLKEWTSKMQEKLVNVYLPRFRIESQYNLGDTLQALGMKKAFSEAEADFSGMLEEPGWKLWIDLVVQKAFLDVNEEGTEAAAASGVLMGGFGGMETRRPKIIVFRADHPFLFLIRDTRTGCILFMGRVTQPPPAE